MTSSATASQNAAGATAAQNGGVFGIWRTPSLMLFSHYSQRNTFEATISPPMSQTPSTNKSVDIE